MGKTDWFVLTIDSNFFICPACHDELILRSPYANAVTKAGYVNPQQPVICSFVYWWVRVAWSWVNITKPPTLTLLPDMMKPPILEAGCSKEPMVHNWLSLNDPASKPISGLLICPSCITNLVKISPELSPAVVRVGAAPSRNTCDLNLLRQMKVNFLHYMLNGVLWIRDGGATLQDLLLQLQRVFAQNVKEVPAEVPSSGHSQALSPTASTSTDDATLPQKQAQKQEEQSGIFQIVNIASDFMNAQVSTPTKEPDHISEVVRIGQVPNSSGASGSTATASTAAATAPQQQDNSSPCEEIKQGSFYVLNLDPQLYPTGLVSCVKCFDEVVKDPGNVKSSLTAKWEGSITARAVCMLYSPRMRSLYSKAAQSGNTTQLMQFADLRFKKMVDSMSRMGQLNTQIELAKQRRDYNLNMQVLKQSESNWAMVAAAGNMAGGSYRVNVPVSLPIGARFRGTD